jgi:hypothetical protein
LAGWIERAMTAVDSWPVAVRIGCAIVVDALILALFVAVLNWRG